MQFGRRRSLYFVADTNRPVTSRHSIQRICWPSIGFCSEQQVLELRLDRRKGMGHGPDLRESAQRREATRREARNAR